LRNPKANVKAWGKLRGWGIFESTVQDVQIEDAAIMVIG
jgi:hypothetical protein